MNDIYKLLIEDLITDLGKKRYKNKFKYHNFNIKKDSHIIYFTNRDHKVSISIEIKHITSDPNIVDISLIDCIGNKTTPISQETYRKKPIFEKIMELVQNVEIIDNDKSNEIFKDLTKSIKKVKKYNDIPGFTVELEDINGAIIVEPYHEKYQISFECIDFPGKKHSFRGDEKKMKACQKDVEKVMKDINTQLVKVFKKHKFM